MWYINSRVFNGGDFKNDKWPTMEMTSVFLYKNPNPLRGGGRSQHLNIMWYINCRVLNGGDFKKDIIISLQTPSGEGGGRRPTHKILCDISIPGFSMMRMSKMTNDLQWKYWCQFWNAHYWKPYNWYILNVLMFFYILPVWHNRIQTFSGLVSKVFLY